MLLLYFRNNISNKSSASRGVTKKNDIYGTYNYNYSNIDIDFLIGEVSMVLLIHQYNHKPMLRKIKRRFLKLLRILLII
jgi:hypothetical protein